MSKTPVIVASAIKLPNGVVESAKWHGAVVSILNRVGEMPPSGAEFGFIDSQDNFLDRGTAAMVARSSGQVGDNVTELWDEDIWPEPLTQD